MGIHRIVAVLALLASLLAGPYAAFCGESPDRIAPVLGDDGLYTQPWFLISFLDLKDDLAESAAKGRRLAIVWEQRGCSYCKKMHDVNFALPKINRFVRENFQVLQLNLFGAREVTDFDGQVLPEKALARKWGVIGTPTIMFFPVRAEDAIGKSGRAAEVARLPGYLPPDEFLAMFQYVREQRTADQSFNQYLAQRMAELQRRGRMTPAAQ